MHDDNPYAAELEVACALARQAGKVILEHYADNFTVEYKGSGQSNPVTQADRDANHIIVKGLREHFPDDAILAEESSPHDSRYSKARLWCVDPLDGTKEFIARNGEFSVMIGLAVDGNAEAGVVYQPTIDTLYWGAAGHAYIQEGNSAARRLQVKKVAADAEITLMVSRSHRNRSIDVLAKTLQVRAEIPRGSVGLKVAAIARGEGDAYISMTDRTSEWDACAPEAILRAAGGAMTDVRGRALRYNKRDTTRTPFGLLASNGSVHALCCRAAEPLAAARGWV